jgi:hypothetical protein
MAVFRRRSIREVTDASKKFCVHGNATAVQGRRLAFVCFGFTPNEIAVAAESPQPGEEVFPSIEIMLDGKPHTHPYAPLTSAALAPWSDWDLALGFAAKIEWFSQARGKWLCKYIQQSDAYVNFAGHSLIDDAATASITDYSMAMALRRFFLRQKCPDFAEAWQHDLRIAQNVKEVIFENFTQTIKLEDLKVTYEGAVPTRKPFDTLVQKLKALGAENIMAPPSDNLIIGPDLGRACDFCHITRQNTGSLSRCRIDPSGNSCTVCVQAGMPCSFTQKPTQDLYEALRIR